MLIGYTDRSQSTERVFILYSEHMSANLVKTLWNPISLIIKMPKTDDPMVSSLTSWIIFLENILMHVKDR